MRDHFRENSPKILRHKDVSSRQPRMHTRRPDEVTHAARTRPSDDETLHLDVIELDARLVGLTDRIPELQHIAPDRRAGVYGVLYGARDFV